MSDTCRAGCTARTAEMPNISYGLYTLLSDSALRTLLTRKATNDQPARTMTVLERKKMSAASERTGEKTDLVVSLGLNMDFARTCFLRSRQGVH